MTPENLGTITVLDLGEQTLTSVTAADLAQLSSLEELYLDGNDLTALPAGVFDELTNLEVLDLSDNALTELPADVFNELTNLEELYLDGTDLAELPAFVFHELTNLQVLDLRGTPGFPFAPEVFRPLTSLATYNEAPYTPTPFALTRRPELELSYITLLVAGNAAPSGLWSDGTTLWVGDSEDRKLYAYELATQYRDPTQDMLLDEQDLPFGLWSDGTTIYVLTQTRRAGRISAYNLETRQRDPERDISMSRWRRYSEDLWGNDTTLWVSDYHKRKIYAYDRETRQEDPARKFASLAASHIYPEGLWSDGTTLWVSGSDYRLYAYNLETRQYEPGKDFLLHEDNGWPSDLWSDGRMLHVLDDSHKRTYAYELPPQPHDATLRTLSLSGLALNTFDPDRTTYTMEVDSSVAALTVTAEAWAEAVGTTVTVYPPDADPATDGHQIALSEGDITLTLTLTVTAPDGTTTQLYTVTVTRAAPSNDATLSALALSDIALPPFASATTRYTADVAHDVATTTVTATTTTEGARVSVLPDDADPDTPGHQLDLSVGVTLVSVTVASEDGRTTQTYTVVVTRAPAPFEILPEELTRHNILDHLRAHEVGSVEDFIQALPPLHKRHVAFVYDSAALFQEFVSPTYPRVVSWGAAGRFIFSWATDPASPVPESVEFLRAHQERWIAGVIDFSGDTVDIREPAVCAGCHGGLNKPLWGEEDLQGTEGDMGIEDVELYTWNATTSSHPRLAPLDVTYSRDPLERNDSRRSLPIPKGTVGKFASAPRELVSVLAWRHAEVLFAKVRLRADYPQIARDVVCAAFPDRQLTAYFSVGDHHVARLGDGSTPVQDANVSRFPLYTARASNMGHSFAFLILHDLVEREPRVAVALADHAAAIRRTHRAHFGYPGSATIEARAQTPGTGTYSPAYRSSEGLSIRDHYRLACAALQAGGAAFAAATEADGMTVTGMRLVDGTSGENLGALQEGDVVNPDALATEDWQIQVEVAGATPVDSVELAITAVASAARTTQTDNTAPYVFDGGLAADEYYVTATPYPALDQGSTPGRPLTLRFSVAVTLPDAGLRAAVERALGKEAGAAITVQEMATLTTLDVSDETVTDLSGLEYAVNLTDLFLGSNQIADRSSVPQGATVHVSLPLSDDASLSALTLSGIPLAFDSAVEHYTVEVAHDMVSTTVTATATDDAAAAVVMQPGDADSSLAGHQIALQEGPTTLTVTVTAEDGVTTRSYSVVVTRAPAPADVTIADPLIRAAIEAALGKAAGEAISQDEMTEVTLLEVKDAGISDLTGLEYAVNLTRLTLKGNDIADLGPLAGLTNLTNLNLNDNAIANLTPLANMSRLRILLLRDNAIADLTPLAQLSALRRLNLRDNNVSNLNPLAGLSLLKRMSLKYNQVTDLTPLAGLHELVRLWLHGNQITDFSPLDGLPNLTVYGQADQILD